MTAEEAAINALKEALYHILYEDRAGSRHATRVAEQLYNVFGFGYVAGAGQNRMLWAGQDGEPSAETAKPIVPELPPSEPKLDDLIDGAWHHYRLGSLATAARWAHAALGLNPAPEKSERLQWLIAMFAYYSAEFDRACALLPHPKTRPKPDDGWWRKNMLTLARASARIGQLDRAQGLLDELVHESLAWADLAIAIPIMEGCIAHGRGDPERAASALEQGYKAIDRLRAAQREREEGKLGEPPYFEVGAIQAAIVDAAALMIALEESERALGVILPQSNLFTPL